MTHTTQVLSDEQIFIDWCKAREESTRTSDQVRAFARAIESATLKAVSGQEPIGYFRTMPFGWEDCAETDDGAMPLYELPPAQPAPAMTPSAVELLAEKYANHDFCSDYLSTITSIVREVEARAALQCAQAPQPTKGQP